MTAEARPAATVVVLRDGEQGPEVLMLKRSGRSGFFPHAWVFPGGRVDPADAEAQSTGTATGLPEADTAYAVAAIRECYEEAGVWMGDGAPPAAFRESLNDHSATLRDAPELVADLGRLAVWSWWITPELEPKRYDTRFFVAVLHPHESEGVSHDEIETVSSAWLTPADALARAAEGDFFLAPPTFRTLEELVTFGSGAEVMAAAQTRKVQPVMPRLDMGGDAVSIVLPGDPSYPSDTPVDGPTRIVFRQGRWGSHS